MPGRLQPRSGTAPASCERAPSPPARRARHTYPVGQEVRRVRLDQQPVRRAAAVEGRQALARRRLQDVRRHAKVEVGEVGAPLLHHRRRLVEAVPVHCVVVRQDLRRYFQLCTYHHPERELRGCSLRNFKLFHN